MSPRLETFPFAPIGHFEAPIAEDHRTDRRPAQLAAMPVVAAAGATVGVVCAGHAGDGGAAAEPATVGLDAGHVATIATDCARLTDRGACTDTTIATALGAVVGDLTDLARPLSSRRRGTFDLDVADSGTGVHAVLRAHPARRSPEGRCEEREFHQPRKRARVHAQVMLTSPSGIQARRPRLEGAGEAARGDREDRLRLPG